MIKYMAFQCLSKCSIFRRTVFNKVYNPRLNKQFTSDAMNPPVEFKVPTPWGHIAGKEWGPKKGYPVIAVHGWQDHAGTFDTLIPLLKKNLHIYAIDLPGHGLSSHIPQGMTYTHLMFAFAVQRIVDYLKIDKFCYLGHSMGCQAGFTYCSTYPENVSHFICLENFKPIIDPINLVAATLRENYNYFSKLERSGMTPPTYTEEEIIEKICSNIYNSISKESAKILFQRGAVQSSDSRFSFARDSRLRKYIEPFILSNDELILYGSNMKCHVLFIRAIPRWDFEPHQIEKCSIDTIKNCVPSFKYHEVTGSHHVHLNSPELVAPYINEMLDV